MHDHYSHIINVKSSESLIAVSCTTCRSVAFYKHSFGADNAIVHHRAVCSAPKPHVTIIMATAVIEAARRVPEAE